MELRLNASQISALRALFARMPELLVEELHKSVIQGDRLIQGELGQALPKGAGAQSGAGLAGSLFSEETVLSDNVVGVTASQQPYALIVEIGRQPGKMPPHEPIVAWVRAKLGVDDDQADSVAFLIRRKIAREGTAAQPIWERTLQANELQILAFVGQGIDRALTRLTR